MLEPEDRDTFYLLEAIGVLDTEREELHCLMEESGDTLLDAKAGKCEKISSNGEKRPG